MQPQYRDDLRLYAHWASPWYGVAATALWLALLLFIYQLQLHLNLSDAVTWLLVCPLWLATVAGIFSAFLRTAVARAILGKDFRAQSSAMLKATARASRTALYVVRAAALAVLIVAALIFFVALDFSAALAFLAFFITQLGTVLLRATIPPLIVYFANSREERIYLFARLQMAVPATVGAMLSVEGTLNDALHRKDSFLSLIRRVLLVQFDMRLRPTAGDWEQEAKRLMLVTPLILFDARDTSEGVMRELEQIVGLQLQHKTWLVADNSGRCPALDCLEKRGGSVPSDLKAVREGDLIRLLNLHIKHALVTRHVKRTPSDA